MLEAVEAEDRGEAGDEEAARVEADQDMNLTNYTTRPDTMFERYTQLFQSLK